MSVLEFLSNERDRLWHRSMVGASSIAVYDMEDEETWSFSPLCALRPVRALVEQKATRTASRRAIYFYYLAKQGSAVSTMY